MKKKLLSTILIMVMVFTATVMSMPAASFAEPTIADEDRYLTFDVRAPKGNIVVIESIDYEGTGITSDLGTGEYGPEIFDDGVEPFFAVDHTTLPDGRYYYKVTEKDQSATYPKVEYDKSEYIVCVHVMGGMMSIILQKDDEDAKPMDIEFENCVNDTREVYREITYTEYTPSGKKVSDTVTEKAVLKRKLRSDAYGNPIDSDGNPIAMDAEGNLVNPEDESKLIYLGENGNPLGYDSTGRAYETDDAGNPVTDSSGNIKYRTKWTVESVSPSNRAASPIKVGADGKAMVTTSIKSPDHSEGYIWAPDKEEVGGWEIDLNNPPPNGHKETIPVIYVPETMEEEITVTRTITYTEITPDGKEVAKTVTQTARLTRRVRIDKNGNPVKDDQGRTIIIGSNGHPIGYDKDGNPILCNADGTPELDENGNPKKTTIWILDVARSDTGAVKSPDHKEGADKWTPNMSEVGEWVIDLDNPKDEIVHVIYVPKDEPLPPVEVEEFMTITRTITYTEYTADGKQVSKTVVQTVRLKRIVKKDADGNVIETGKWEIVDGDQSAIKAPGKDGWTANITNVPFWEIDLDNPQNIVIHVIYVPNDQINTGDENNLMLWGGLLGGAVIVALLLLLARKKDKKDDSSAKN